ncbi:hypothetical protein GQX73_g9913 [Xylaria multiplex]|uniref:Uncharacterized protein n=1 Tax=Xylaria multiplex TaxID=323545 RepID=A0A7C8MRD8_9PEZI|nr:hypothetical protein GQX73_g9913 [Xylaria multiplex]
MSPPNQEAFATLVELGKDALIHLEWASTRFWEYLFKLIFNGFQWIISSQQPPTKKDDDLRRVDIVIEKMQQTTIENVEFQAFTAACAHCIETRRSHMWVMTSVGVKARLWIFHIDSEYLIPYIPVGKGLAEIGEYLDANTNLNLMIAALEFVRENTTPPTHLLSMSSSPRPTNVVLPSNWHDHEVSQVDAHRLNEAVLAGSRQTFDWSEDTTSLPRYDGLRCIPVVYGEGMMQNESIGHMCIGSNQQVWIADDAWQRAYIVIQDMSYLGYVHEDTSGSVFYMLDKVKPEVQDPIHLMTVPSFTKMLMGTFVQSYLHLLTMITCVNAVTEASRLGYSLRHIYMYAALSYSSTRSIAIAKHDTPTKLVAFVIEYLCRGNIGQGGP